MLNNKVRPMHDFHVQNGEYTGRIMDALFKEMPSMYHTSGYREVLSIRVRVFHDSGETPLFYTVNFDWSNRRFVKTLEDLDVLPERGQAFDPRLLDGQNVMVTILNEEKNGINYSNIVTLKSLKPEEGFCNGGFGGAK